MIANNWKKCLAKANMTQNQLADAAVINKAELSRVCAGAAVPAYDTLRACASTLGCEIEDIYGADALRVLYQIDEQERPQKRQRIRVQLSSAVVRLVDAAVDYGEYESRYAAVNQILLEALR